MAGLMERQTDSPARAFRLPNGLSVLILPDSRFPLVSIRLYIHAGAVCEPPEQAGISHILEHMAFKGTSRRPAGTVAGDIEKIGGDINAATSFDYTVYMADLPAEHWKTGLDVLEDMAFHPLLDAVALEAEKEVIIAELKRGEDSPGGLLFKRLQAMSLPDTPYARPVIGYENTIKNVTSQNLIDYIERYYQPQSCLLLVCGHVDRAETEREIGRLYGELRNSHPVTPEEALDCSSLPVCGPRIHIERGNWNKVYFGLAFPAPSQRDAASAHLDVLCSLLGSGKTSYFHRKYKYDLRMIDSISLTNYSFERLGLLSLTAVLDAEKLEDFWTLLVADLRDISSIAFTRKQLERVKLNIEDDLYRAKETLSGLASKQGYFAFFENGAQSEKNYVYALRKTSLQDLRGLLEDIAVLPRLSVTALLPEKNSDAVTGEEAKASREPEKALRDILLENWPERKSRKRERKTASAKNTLENIDLGSGRRLILVPDNTLPYVSATMMLAGGDFLAGFENQGLAALVAAMLTRGTGTFSANQLEDYTEDRAAYISANAGRQSLSLALSAPRRFSRDIFSLLRTIMLEPAFPEDELFRCKSSQIAQIRAADDQPMSLAMRRVFPFLFGNHPYGFIKLGTPESVGRVQTEHLRSFWNAQLEYPWALAVCGSFERDAMLRVAETLPLPNKPEIKIAVPDWGVGKKLQLRLPGRNQTHIMLAFPTVGLGHDDSAALDLLQSVLSGQSGLLFRNLRDEQGLGYTVTALPWTSQQAGCLIFYIATDPLKAEAAKSGFTKIVRRLRENALPESELVRGKNGFRGEYFRNHQSLSSRCSEAATMSILNFPLDQPSRQIEKSALVGPERLLGIARKYLNLEDAYWITVEP